MFIALTKAFDTVNHGILLQKLERLSIRQRSREVIEIYNQQRVKISIVIEIESCTGQESVKDYSSKVK